VNMGGVQIKELPQPEGIRQAAPCRPHLVDTIQRPPHSVVVEFSGEIAPPQKQLRSSLANAWGKPEQRAPSREGVKHESQHDLAVTHPSFGSHTAGQPLPPIPKYEHRPRTIGRNLTFACTERFAFFSWPDTSLRRCQAPITYPELVPASLSFPRKKSSQPLLKKVRNASQERPKLSRCHSPILWDNRKKSTNCQVGVFAGYVSEDGNRPGRQRLFIP